MNGEEWTLAAVWVLTAVLLLFQPWMSRKNVAFGVVFGSDRIWEEKEVRGIRRRYCLAAGTGMVLITAALAGYALLFHPDAEAEAAAFLIGLVVLLTYGTAVYIVFHGRMRSYKASRTPDANLVSDKISVELSLPDRDTVVSAGWFALFLPVLLATYAAALFGYPLMPSSVPVHYNMRAADAWAEKSGWIVLEPALLSTLSTAILFVCGLFMRRAPASVRGNPEAAPKAYRFRKYSVFLLLFTAILMQSSFLAVEAGYFVFVPPLWFLLPSLAGVVLVAAVLYLYFRFVRAKKPKGEILDDDDRWVLGMFYYDPANPSVFVEKRVGIGYTPNYGRPAAWLMTIGIIAVIVASVLLSTRS